MSKGVTRYSDAELAEFKEVIEKRMAKTKESMDGLQTQILEITENTSDEHGGDWVDDSSINSDIEMLNNMAIRQRRYLKDLENALIRIRNRSYGICVLTGELIDKKRLMAVPTTTKSLSAKTESQSKASKGFRPRSKPPRQKIEKKIISKVIRKPNTGALIPAPLDDDEEEMDFFLDEEIINPAEEDLADLRGDDESEDDIEENDDDNPFISGKNEEDSIIL